MSIADGLSELTTSRQQRQGWQYLRLFNYYRSALALLFVVMYLNGWTELFIRQQEYSAKLFLWGLFV